MDIDARGTYARVGFTMLWRRAKNKKKYDPKKGWYRDRKGKWHQLKAADGWYRTKKGKWKNKNPDQWYKDNNGVWKRKPKKNPVVSKPGPSPNKEAPNRTVPEPEVIAPVPGAINVDVTEARVKLSWSAAPGQVAGYEVLRSTSPDRDFQVLINTAHKEYTDWTVQINTTYYYAVRVKNRAGQVSALSAVTMAQVRDTTAPPAPSSFSASSADRQVVLSWSPVQDKGLAGYEVLRGLGSTGSLQTIAKVPKGQTGYTDSQLKNGTTYRYQVRAYDQSDNRSAPTTTLSAKPFDTAVPAVPTGLAIQPGESQLVVQWNKVNDYDLSHYEVRRSTQANSGYQTLTTVPAGSTAYEDQQVVAGTMYYYQVRAVDTSGNTGPSSASVSMIAADSESPALPTDISSLPSSNQVILAWFPSPSSDLESYEIHRSTQPSSGFSPLGTAPATALGYADLTPNNGVTYYYRVRSKDRANNYSPFSTSVSAMPLAAASPLVYNGSFGAAQAERLLWRAGFGPRAGEVSTVASLGLDQAVNRLTEVSGDATLSGPAPTATLDEKNGYGHDHAWWLDRMIRSDQQLVERMTLIFHDWFATSNNGVDNQPRMIEQNQLLRRHALGNFHQLVKDITIDPAMLVWLNGVDNTKTSPNENYARELMELFTLGADRGNYSELDIREAARALTGWKRNYASNGTWTPAFDTNRFDNTNKTIFGQTGNFKWDDVVRMCVQHPGHPSFFVTKLWSYFVPTAPSDVTRVALEKIYKDSGYEIKPVVKAILRHPDFYQGAPLVKNPSVHIAGLHRLRNSALAGTSWYARGSEAAMRLFYPPDVSGWDDKRWLDTSTMRGRWQAVYTLLDPLKIPTTNSYSTTETAQQALDSALDFWGNPTISQSTYNVLLAYAQDSVPPSVDTSDSNRRAYRISRQNALRLLIAMSPDLQVC